MEKKYERMLENMEVRASGPVIKWLLGKTLKVFRWIKKKN